MNHPDYWVAFFFFKFVIITNRFHMENAFLCGIQKVIFLIKLLVAEAEWGLGLSFSKKKKKSNVDKVVHTTPVLYFMSPNDQQTL